MCVRKVCRFEMFERTHNHIPHVSKAYKTYTNKQTSNHLPLYFVISSLTQLLKMGAKRCTMCTHTHSERSETVKGVFLLLLSFFSSPCLHIFVIISVYFAHLHCRRFRCCCYCRCHHHRCRCRNFSAKKKQQQREKDI